MLAELMCGITSLSAPIFHSGTEPELIRAPSPNSTCRSFSILPADAAQRRLEARAHVLAQLGRHVEAAAGEVQGAAGRDLREARHVGRGDLGDARIAAGR